MSPGPAHRGRAHPGQAHAAGAGLVAAGVTWAARQVLDTTAARRSARWARTNHRGELVSLLEGPAVVLGLLAGSLVAVRAAPRTAGALAVAALGGGAFGLVDDLSEDTATARKGLRGHLGALAHGELTTGGLKVLGIGASSVLAAAIAPRRSGDGSDGPVSTALDVLASGALIAATANLVNLLDLRPGRALKATAIGALPLLAAPPAAPGAAACLGAAAAAVGADLGERDMLGDGGANALGATLGTAAVLAGPRRLRWALLGAAVALTVASERVSFTAVIERTPALRRLDDWGRRRSDEDRRPGRCASPGDDGGRGA